MNKLPVGRNEQLPNDKPVTRLLDDAKIHGDIRRKAGEYVDRINNLEAENARLRDALDSIGNMAYTALHVDDGPQHCILDEFTAACVRILDAANEALESGAK